MSRPAGVVAIVSFEPTLDLEDRFEQPHRAFVGRRIAGRFLDLGIASGLPRKRGHYAIRLLLRLAPGLKRLLTRASELDDRVSIAQLAVTASQIEHRVRHMRELTW